MYLSHNLIYFSVPKEVILNSAHYLIMKIHSERELKNIATNHSVDIDYKDFMKIYRKSTSEPDSVVTIDTKLETIFYIQYKNDITWWT